MKRAAVALLAVAGCSSPSSCRSSEPRAAADAASARADEPDATSPSAEANGERAPFPLAELRRKIEASASGDACEPRVAPRRRDVERALEPRWAEIEAYGAGLGDATPFRRERLGPTYVRVAAGGARAAGPSTRERSWDALAGAAAALPGQIDERWFVVLREARALLVFDLQRTSAGAWRDGTRQALGPQEVTAAAPIVRDGAALVVPLDPGDLEQAKDALAAHIEAVWRSDALRVRVRWTSQRAEPQAFRFVLEGELGAPSHASTTRREIVLNPDVRTHAIAHEVGHVLGLGDRYAKRYDAARCVYVDEIDPSDIMSEPDGGVTPLAWSLLDRAYPR